MLLPLRSFRVLCGALFFVCLTLAQPLRGTAGADLSLNGVWEVGEGRDYRRRADVPGLAQDPAKVSPDTLWYRRTVTLPAGAWTRATLTLNGARFAPAVFVNGEPVSTSEGGMAPTVHLLRSPAVAPGATVQLEIALKSLRDLDPLDASATPGADRWRTNISSGLWDSVTLHFSGDTRIARFTPWTDPARRSVDVHWALDAATSATGERIIETAVLDASGREIVQSTPVSTRSTTGVAHLDLGDACRPWTPDTPNLYRLRLTVTDAGKITDRREISWALRDFRVKGLGFTLNDSPIQLRAGTVVWHRFLRDPEAPPLAWNMEWFEKNVTGRLRALGANTLRFHLGLPPEALLDLCDRTGLMVQLEWPFFHGIAASQASMEVQYRSWLEVALRHPSVVLLHPWNETDGAQLKRGFDALAAITPDFPPLVISHRDVLHVHKYWWSLFENLGLYYDGPEDFPRPVMADEFGGNYLDGAANPGGYPATRETFLRFLGREHTIAQRLQLNADANARVAEYWRQLGVAGFSPFCILGGPQDGNHWFLGPLASPQPKPVWSALSAAYAPVSVSFALWNRNFTPGQPIEFPLYFFNDRPGERTLEATLRLVAADGSERVVYAQKLSARVAAFGRAVQTARLTFPDRPGDWRVEAQLATAVEGVTAGLIVSSWRCRTLAVATPASIAHLVVGVPTAEPELRKLLALHGARVVEPASAEARTLVFSAASWSELERSSALRAQLEAAVDRGQSVVLLDIGPRDLARYQAEARRNYEGAPTGAKSAPVRQPLFAGLEVVFRPSAEPESHLHPAPGHDELWRSLPRESTWLWNGLRGGLIVPPSEMEVLGLSAAALRAQWIARGADAAKLAAGASCFAYELAGYFAFAEKEKDDAVIAELRRRVTFLAEDAPSLKGRIDPNARLAVTDLARALRDTAQSASASELTPLANAGKNLTRVPIVLVNFGRGRVALSQVITAGRLLVDDHPLQLYELGHDPAAEQLVLNLIALASAQ